MKQLPSTICGKNHSRILQSLILSRLNPKKNGTHHGLPLPSPTRHLVWFQTLEKRRVGGKYLVLVLIMLIRTLPTVPKTSERVAGAELHAWSKTLQCVKQEELLLQSLNIFASLENSSTHPSDVFSKKEIEHYSASGISIKLHFVYIKYLYVIKRDHCLGKSQARR